MLIKTRGIVFRTIKYSETSLIADIYTEAKGLQTYIFGGVRKRKASVSAGLLQVMTLLDLVAYYREGKSMHRVKEIRPAFVYTALPFEVRRSAVGQFICEVARRTMHEPEENPALFGFLFEIFTWLDRTPHEVANLHLFFLVRLSGFLGFLPRANFSPETPYFHLQEGYFSDGSGPPAYLLSAEDSNFLAELLGTDLHTVHQLKPDPGQRRRLLNGLLDYYRLHIENFPTIHSHTILQEVLGQVD